MNAWQSRLGPALAVLGASGLAACGGSSGGSTPSIAVTFNPPALSASYAQGSLVAPVNVTVTLSSLPGGSLYGAVAQDHPVLAPGTIAVTPVGPTAFSAALRPSCTLDPGSHAGNLTLRICHDAGCTSEVPLTGNVLPYAFTVSVGQILTARIGGVAAAGFVSQCTAGPLSANVGQLVELTSSIPVTWSTSIFTSAGVPVISAETSTATTWAATLGEQGGGNTPGVFYGSVQIQASPAGGGAPVLATVNVLGG